MRTVMLCTAVPAKCRLLYWPGCASHAEKLYGRMTTPVTHRRNLSMRGIGSKPGRTQCFETPWTLARLIWGRAVPHLLSVSPRGCD